LKWPFDITADYTNGIRESFLSLDLFSLVFQNIFMALLQGGGAITLPPYGFTTALIFLALFAAGGDVALG